MNSLTQQDWNFIMRVNFKIKCTSDKIDTTKSDLNLQIAVVKIGLPKRGVTTSFASTFTILF